MYADVMHVKVEEERRKMAKIEKNIIPVMSQVYKNNEGTWSWHLEGQIIIGKHGVKSKKKAEQEVTDYLKNIQFIECKGEE